MLHVLLQSLSQKDYRILNGFVAISHLYHSRRVRSLDGLQWDTSVSNVAAWFQAMQ